MRGKYKKLALCLSLLLVTAWAVLGTSASLAWFTDTDEEVKNVFHFGEFDLEVSHRLPDGSWEAVEQGTKLFDEDALYEPGYVQVVYLRIENKGDVPFNFKTAITVTDYTVATNVFGQSFQLQDYLRFGVGTADTETEMDALVAQRELTYEMAQMPLSNYATEVASLEGGQTAYMVLVVRMPEEVDNVANYRGEVVPRVELGVIVSATQQKE